VLCCCICLSVCFLKEYQQILRVRTASTAVPSTADYLSFLPAGRAGVPMEVMGLMLGEFVDDYTVRVVDVFAMPQSGTGVSVEAVDPVFQTKMLDMLKQVGRCAEYQGCGFPLNLIATVATMIE
jgi:hypothetical protein